MKGRKNHMGRKSNYSPEFMKMVARDYLEGNLSYSQITNKYKLSSKGLVGGWVRRHKNNPELAAQPIPPMSEKEKQEKQGLDKQIKALQEQLEHERLRNLALETLIDVAEEELEVDIRKKPGTKQLDD